MKRKWQIIDAFVVALTVVVVMMLFIVVTVSAMGNRWQHRRNV
jgi:ABC-type transport system involved in Fe-S cluster assembly fused permease/ATPase subunit